MIRISRSFVAAIPQVSFNYNQGVLAIRLTRPKALNSLSLQMIRYISHLIKSHQPTLIQLTGEGKAFCAGGDVKSLLKAKRSEQASESDEVVQFFREQYKLDYLLGKHNSYRVESLLKGVVMGGGYGLTSQNHFRIATPSTLFAMPQNKLGLFPDVGATVQLSRIGHVGRYLALTGATIDGKEMVRLGLADCFVQDAAQLQSIQKDMIKGQRGIADKYKLKEQPNLGESALKSQTKLFQIQDLKVLFSQLAKSKDPFSKKTLAFLKTLCPFSLHVTNQILNRNLELKMGFKERLVQDYRLAVALTYRTDFLEGVKAVLVEKREAKWKESSIQQVSMDEVREAFKAKVAQLQL